MVRVQDICEEHRMNVRSSAGNAVPVTADNFNRAESDMYFAESEKLAGGIGKFNHHREVMSIDKQTLVRANRETLYSSAVFDLDGGPVSNFWG
jgi:hypothetical protein